VRARAFSKTPALGLSLRDTGRFLSVLALDLWLEIAHQDCTARVEVRLGSTAQAGSSAASRRYNVSARTV
jgi:hypothetical protein